MMWPGSVALFAVVSGNGGPEFKRQLDKAVKCYSYHSQDVRPHEIKGVFAATRRKRFFDALAKVEKADTIVTLCHGVPTAVNGLGIGYAEVDKFADEIDRVGADTVVLYCCLAGKQEVWKAPIATELSKRLPDVDIFTHTTAGHTTHNPFMVRIRDRRAYWVAYPHSDVWRVWRARLADDLDDMRFAAPYYGAVELEKALAE